MNPARRPYSSTPVLVLNGPNLGRLGRREPAIYGATTHAELAELCVQTGAQLGLDVQVRQTDCEGELLRWLHEAADHATPVVLNAGALTHTSVAVGDACAILAGSLVEVHISNIFKREPFRHHSYVSPHATGVLVGFGVHGYVLALRALGAQSG